ncbi:ABC transporter ATP-binding protein [Betaproteobacteria bacterium]|nr:ABC transporter ATP-binding protein [Betaproteobacteria bacterium]GHU27830.1 ABC transporter ATP-binding protein [Betaproteobacteria bacterium]
MPEVVTAAGATKPALLEVDPLTVTIRTAGGEIRPVDGVGLSIAAGETYALVGESGCGKSMTALAIARLLPDAAKVVSGAVRLDGEDLLALPEARMRRLRGGRIGMIFQEPATSLNPVATVGDQIGEALALHRGLRGAAARAEARRLLEAVGIPAASARLDDYPFQLSGGMKQRVMIAMALSGEPGLLIADEPTTALDVTIQAQVLELLAGLQVERNMAMLLITHDLGVVAKIAQQVGVLYAGELIESGRRASFFTRPLHPYTQRLFDALPDRAARGHRLAALPGTVPALGQAFVGCRFAPRCPQAFPRCKLAAPQWQQVGEQQVRCHLYASNDGAEIATAKASADTSPADVAFAHDGQPLLEARELAVHFPLRTGLLRRKTGVVKAVDGVSLKLTPGRTLALVGESGCGKTTVGRSLLHLPQPTAGTLHYQGEEIRADNRQSMRKLRHAVQMVFQDPFASLNPRLTIGEILEEGMVALGVGEDAAARQRTVDALLERIGLSPTMRWRYPHEFSGGQRQRIAIARALAVSPQVIVCDEPTSALDVSVQAQLLNLMGELQRERGLAYLFITHNLAVVRYLADDVAVMYLGRIVEEGPAGKIFDTPAHPYTRALLDAVLSATGAEAPPEVGKVRPALELPSPLAPPPGCHFHPRCPRADEACRQNYPEPRSVGEGHVVRCHFGVS